MTDTLNSVFIGSGGLLVKCLDLAAKRSVKILSVISTDEKVISYCQENNLEFCHSINELKIKSFDYLFSIANPYILIEKEIKRAKRLAINYHNAPLPQYAGLNGTTWAIINNEKVHSICWHIMQKEIDAGDIIESEEFLIDKTETTLSLNLKCNDACIISFVRLLNGLVKNNYCLTALDLSKRQYYSAKSKISNGGMIDWHTPGENIERIVRALTFGPYENPMGTPKIRVRNKTYIVAKCEVLKQQSSTTPGQIIKAREKYYYVTTLSGIIKITQLTSPTGEVVNKFPYVKNGYDLHKYVIDEEEANKYFNTNEKIIAKRLSALSPLTLKSLEASKLLKSYEVVGKSYKVASYNRTEITAAILFSLATITSNKQVSIAVAGSSEKSMIFEDFDFINFDMKQLATVKEMLKQISTKLGTLNNDLPIDMLNRYQEDGGVRFSDCAINIPLLIFGNHNNYIQQYKPFCYFTVVDGKLSLHYRKTSQSSPLEETYLYLIDTIMLALRKCLPSMVGENKKLITLSQQISLLYSKQTNLLCGDKKPLPGNLLQAIMTGLNRRKNVLAITQGKISISYAELVTACSEKGECLTDLNDSGRVVVIMMDKSIDYLICTLACIISRIPFIPIPTKFSKKKLQTVIKTLDINLIITTNPELTITNFKHCYQQQAVNIFKIETPLQSQKKLKNITCVMHTSGTTGSPKLIPVKSTSIYNLLESVNQLKKIKLFEHYAVWTDINFDVFLYEVLSCFINSGTLHLYSEETRLVPEAYIKALHKDKVASAYIPAFMLHELKAHLSKNKKTSLKRVLVGVEPIKLELLQDITKKAQGVTIINGYGPTEATICVTLFKVSNNSRYARINVPIGKPVNNSKALVINHDNKAVHPGIKGELIVSGAPIFSHYLSDDIAPMIKINNAQYYKTGDHVWYDTDGNLHFCGRQDRQIKLNGIRLELGEIEAQLSTIDQIEKAVAIHKKDESYIQIYYTTYKGAALRAEVLSQKIKASLSQVSYLCQFTHIQQFNYTANGKIDYQYLDKLKTTYKIDSGSRHSNYKTNKVSTRLLALYKKLFKVSEIDVEADFFMMGGNSITVALLLIEIEKAFKVRLKNRDIYESRTLSNVATLIALSSNNSNLKTLPKTGKKLALVSKELRSLLLIDEISADLTRYNLIVAYQLNSNLVMKKLQNTIDLIMHNNAIFRTQFYKSGDSYFQKTKAYVKGSIPIIVDNAISASAIVKFANEPFDLMSGNLLRVMVDNDNRKLFFIMPHLCIDEFSVRLLQSEFERFYNNDKPVKSSNNLSYLDYSIYKKDGKAQQSTGKLLEKLNSGDYKFSIFNISTNHAISQGTYLQHNLSSNATAKLVSDLNHYSITPLAYLISLISIATHYYFTTDKFVIGTPFSTRVPGTESIIGCFINTLPLPITVNNDTCFAEHLAHVKRLIKLSYDERFTNLSDLITGLNKLDNRRDVIYDIFAAFVPEYSPIDAGDVSAERFYCFNGTTKFPLSIFLQAGENYSLWAEFDKEIVNEHIVGHFLACLEVVLLSSSAESTINQIFQLSKAETSFTDEHLITAETNDTKAITIDSDDSLAIYAHQKLSYSEFNLLVSSLSHYFTRKYGIDKKIGLLLQRSEAYPVLCSAIALSNNYIVAIDANFPVARIQSIIDDALLCMLVFTESLSAKAEQLKVNKKISYEALSADAQSIKKASVSNILLTQIKYMIYTSGSTGTPKGIVQNANTVLHLVNCTSEYMEKNSRVALYSNFAFDVALQATYAAILTHSTVYVLPDDVRTDPLLFLEYLTQHEINYLFLPPVVLELICMASEASDYKHFPHLQRIMSSGEQLHITSSIKHFFHNNRHCRLENHYGPAETHNITRYILPADLAMWPEYPPVGKPLPGMKLAILNKEFKQVPVGVPGELFLSGYAVADGYLRDPSSEYFLTLNNTRYYRTRDIAKLGFDGNVYYEGRSDSQIKINGIRVELSEIQSALLSITNANHVLVISHKNQAGVTRILAFIKPELNQVINFESVYQDLRELLPSYMMPASISVIDAIPLTLNGKLDRKSLIALAQSKQGNDSTYANNTPDDKVANFITSNAAYLTGHDEGNIQLNSNFFDIGGTSITVAKFVTALSLKYKKTLSISKFIKDPTLSNLYYQIVSHTKDNSISIIKSMVNSLLNSSLPIVVDKIKPTKRVALITGATGFVGSHLLHKLVSDYDQVVCLVRKVDESNPLSRLAASNHVYGIKLSKISKVFAHYAEIDKPNFGLDMTIYNYLKNNVSSVFHCAAHVNHSMEVDGLQGPNFKSTLEFIKFSKQGCQKDIIYLSTTGLSLGLDTLQPEVLFKNTRTLQNGYLQTKYLSECALIQAQRQGLKVKIFRLPFIMPVYGRNDIDREKTHILLFIKACLQLGYYPCDYAAFDYLPVDNVSACLMNYDQGEAVNELHNESPVVWDSVFGVFKEKKLKPITYTQWKKLLIGQADYTNSLSPFLSFYTDNAKEMYSRKSPDNRVNAIFLKTQDDYLQTLIQMNRNWLLS